MKIERGRFISFEGIEGVGKTTALNLVREQLEIARIPYVLTREPGGTPLSEDIRDILLNHADEIMCPDTELLLMFASRAQNIARVILPALSRGYWVLSDRFIDSSFAYQCGGRGMLVKHIEELAEWTVKDLKPDLTLLLEAPISVSLSRVKSRGIKDRIEAEGLNFFKRVREYYLALASAEQVRFRLIHTDQDLSSVKKQIIKIIQPLLTFSLLETRKMEI